MAMRKAAGGKHCQKPWQRPRWPGLCSVGLVRQRAPRWTLQGRKTRANPAAPILYLLYRTKYYVFAELSTTLAELSTTFMENIGELEVGPACTSRSRCRNARQCDYCAAVRQRQIGDIAAQIEQQHGPLVLTVLKPEQNTPAAIKALHASFMRRALAPAGVWTVETGEQFRKLHLNILSPKPLPAKWRGCRTYSELLQTTARDAAAYLAKRAGMPEEQQYKGR